MLEVYRCWAPIMVYINTPLLRVELSIAIQGEDNKKRGRSGQEAATNAWEDHDTG